MCMASKLCRFDFKMSPSIKSHEAVGEVVANIFTFCALQHQGNA